MNIGERLYSEHWLYQWIDEEGIKTPGNYIKAIRKRGSFDRLRELSNEVYRGPSSQKGNASTSVIASRKLDFSGAVSCSHFNCMRPLVDDVLGRVWHYFDTVVIDEKPLDHILLSGDDVRDLLQLVKLFLYFRNIGAEKYLSFTSKVSGLCTEHFREHAEERHLNLDVLDDEEFERDVVRNLTSAGVFSEWFGEDVWHYEIQHPLFGQLTGRVAHSDPSHRPSHEDIARSAFGKCCAALISDVSASRSLGLPLLDSTESTWVPETKVPDDRIVALNMRLPVLANVPIKEVLRYRDENQAKFVKFRRTLREAMKEQIEKSGTDSPQAIADEVVASRIKPGLAEIEDGLAGIRKTLQRKISANIALTGAAVSVGAIEHVPLVLTATAAAAAGSVYQVISSNADSKKLAEDSDWYFLWKAQRKFRHQ